MQIRLTYTNTLARQNKAHTKHVNPQRRHSGNVDILPKQQGQHCDSSSSDQPAASAARAAGAARTTQTTAAETAGARRARRATKATRAPKTSEAMMAK